MRLSCFTCYQQGYHSAHPQNVKKLDSLYDFVEVKNKECEDLIEQINQYISSINQSFSKLIMGIKNKYYFQQAQLPQLKSQQLNDLVNQMIKLPEYKSQIITIIEEEIFQIKKIFEKLYQELQLSQLKYNENYMCQKQRQRELYEKAYKLCWDEKKYVEAIQNLDQVLELDPNNVDSLWCKGTCLKNLNKYQDAIICLDKALSIDPNDVTTLTQKGQCLRNLNEYEDAIIWFDKALNIDPNHVISLSQKGQCLRLLKQYYNAITWLDYALKIDPSHVVSLNEKDKLIILKMLQNTLIYLLILVLIIHFHFHAKANVVIDFLGACLEDLQQYSEAMIYYEKSLQIKPNDKWTANRRDGCQKKLKK
ncbi:unnamed protein product [Paramecium sonneborni]|uniref:Tetratricopeptide repeat protein n=1 Tax=Paramecium sonneborni TaxID=65129 RepID=A0A8S1RCF3_9CILI|nr:unnamed protein product [Paramecium sonneborni]